MGRSYAVPTDRARGNELRPVKVLLMKNDTKNETVPAWFTALFRDLVMALQPRDMKPDTCAIYYRTLASHGEEGLTKAAVVLKRRPFFPTSGEWNRAAQNVFGGSFRYAPLPRVCARCDEKGLIVVRYHDGDAFDLAICDCREGQRFRRLGEDGVRQFVATPLGGRIRLTDENRLGLLEDFASAD